MKQLPKPGTFWTVPPDLGKDETRWQVLAVEGAEVSTQNPDGSYTHTIRLKQIGWVRGRKPLPWPKGNFEMIL